MNSKIFTLLTEKLQKSFNLPKYAHIQSSLVDPSTDLYKLPWTPAKQAKFINEIETVLGVAFPKQGTIEQITARLDAAYLSMFFSQIWRPRTETFTFTGWHLAEYINSLNPNRVLDVGCGYNQFKERISNLTGIDPYNAMADYQVDILDFVDDPESYDVVMALGSINFNTIDEIEQRFAKALSFVSKGGRFILRANPGIPHDNGPWVDIFPWNFEVVKRFEKKYNIKLDCFKKDGNGRLYFEYIK